MAPRTDGSTTRTSRRARSLAQARTFLDLLMNSRVTRRSGISRSHAVAIPDDSSHATTASRKLRGSDYQRARGRDPVNARSFQFATPDKQQRDVWRLLLTGATRDDLRPTAKVLAQFLDAVSVSTTPLAETLALIQSDWLAKRELSGEFDWRYYFVKYASMREGGSGIYFAEGGKISYSLCNLRGGMTQMNSLYRDPYLLAAWRKLGEPAGVTVPWFVGYEWSPRWLGLTASGVGIRCVEEGYSLSGPTEPEFTNVFLEAIEALGAGEDGIVRVKKTMANGQNVDSEDCIEIGATLLRNLLSKGL